MPTSRPRYAERTFIRTCILALILLSSLTAAPTQAAEPWQVELALNNDYLTANSQKDDFYTFAVYVEVTYGELTYRWEENAFTDRDAGQRFDESYLTLGKTLRPSWLGEWELWLEGGAAYVGEGLLGQQAQNEVHKPLGIEQVYLDYLDVDDFHPHGRAELSRTWSSLGTWSWGSRVGAAVTPNFRWNTVAAMTARWQTTPQLTVDFLAGMRYADTELALLEPHLEEVYPAAQIRVEHEWGWFAELSLNRYGTGRQHVTFGFTFGNGGDSQRPGDVP